MIPRLAELIAQEEGYGIPGAVPTRDSNPGDLRHSPHSFHTADDPDGIGIIDNPADGWNDLVRQLNLFAAEYPKWTITDFIYTYAPPTENNTWGYLTYICQGLGCAMSTLLVDALRIPGTGVYKDEPS